MAPLRIPRMPKGALRPLKAHCPTVCSDPRPARRPGTIVTGSPCRARSTMASGGAFVMLATALGWHRQRGLRAKERRLFAGGRRFHWAEPLFGGPSAGTRELTSAPQGRRHRLAPPNAGGPGLGGGGCRVRIAVCSDDGVADRDHQEAEGLYSKQAIVRAIIRRLSTP